MKGSNNSVDIAEQDLERKGGEFPPPIAKLLGFRLASLDNGRAAIDLEAALHYRLP